MTDATQPGVSAEAAADTPPPQATPEAPANPRDAVLNRMDEQINAERMNDQQEYLHEHGEELGMAPPPSEPTPDGAQAVAPLHPSEPAPAPAHVPEGLPEGLDQYVVMHNGEPHMKARVHGVDKLIPMTRVQQQAQKLDAADITLQNANALQRDLAQREENIRMNEAKLTQTAENLAANPTPPVPDVSDEVILGEAQDIVSTLFSGKEEDAAAKLAGLIKQSRVPAATAPPIDTTQIANEAAQLARAQMTEEDLKKDAVAGLEQFQSDYPDIMSDPNLYNMADAMTDVIAEEHPEWRPSQLMAEAGKRTRDWLSKQRGETPAGDIPPAPPANSDPSRQADKDNLVRIPQPALGAAHDMGDGEDDDYQSPQDALDEIRSSRGQPV